MAHSREYLRRVRRQAIRRKQRIIKDQNGYWSYKHAGELAKGKIHCSCPMCRRKSSDAAKISDIRKTQRDIDQLMEAGTVGIQAAHKVISRTKSDQRLSVKGLRKTQNRIQP